MNQTFIVSGSVTSGIYNLPVTLQYTLPDGANKQDALNISLVVIVPPNLQITPPNPLPESVNAQEPVSLALELVNGATTILKLTHAEVTATNGEVLDGASIPLDTLAAEEDTSLSALIMPLEEGTLEVTVTLHYVDDLNQPQTIVLTYEAEVQMPPPPPEETPEPVNWFGRTMMALLGLGS